MHAKQEPRLAARALRMNNQDGLVPNKSGQTRLRLAA